MSVKIKINGKVKEFRTLRAAINEILHHHDDEVEILRDHGHGD